MCDVVTAQMDCSQETLLNQQELKHPGFIESVNKTFEQALYISKHAKLQQTGYTINVIVHVLWKDTVENINDSIIQSQIDVLNEDFNHNNSDTVKILPLFKPIVGNGMITFYLSQIVRKQTDSLFGPKASNGYLPHEMKFDTLGGDNTIDADHYMNIWICKIQPAMSGTTPIGNILAYAFPPNGLSNWPPNSGPYYVGEDGLAVDYRCIGRNNPYPMIIYNGSTIFINGRTVTHEVGHYLGLRHIWGDKVSSTTGNNGCLGDDGIADTPNANKGSKRDCDTLRNTCVDTALPWTTSDVVDMVQNYMDYSHDACRHAFTQGQVDFMNAVVAGPRVGLITPASVNENDLAAKTVDLFPNPAGSNLNITSSKYKIQEVEICDVVGRVVAKYYFDAEKIDLSISAFERGTYVVRLTTENKIVISKKLIVE